MNNSMDRRLKALEQAIRLMARRKRQYSSLTVVEVEHDPAGGYIDCRTRAHLDDLPKVDEDVSAAYQPGDLPNLIVIIKTYPRDADRDLG